MQQPTVFIIFYNPSESTEGTQTLFREEPVKSLMWCTNFKISNITLSTLLFAKKTFKDFATWTSCKSFDFSITDA